MTDPLPVEERHSELRGWFDAVCDFYTMNDDPMETAYSDSSFYGDVSNIADIMRGYGDVDGAPGCEKMVLEFVCDGDGEIYGVEIQGQMTGHGDFYLSRFKSHKAVTSDREASGTEGAWAVVTVLYDAYMEVKAAIDSISAAARV